MRKRLRSWVSPPKSSTNKRQNKHSPINSHEPHHSAHESLAIVDDRSRPQLSDEISTITINRPSSSHSTTTITPIDTNNMNAETFAELFSQALMTPQVQSGLRTAIEPLTEKIENKIDVIHQRLDNVETTIDEQHTQMNVMEQKLDDIEQQLRKDNIRIHGLNDEKEEQIQIKLVAFFKEAINIKFDQYDLNNAYRVGAYRPGQPRDIVVKFTSNLIKCQVMRNRKNLKNTGNRIYVNDDLTKYRSMLYKHSRDLVRDKRIHSTWTTDGNILAKLHENSKPIRINTESQLMNLSTM